MLPKDLSIGDRFKLAREAGFEQIECPTTPDEKEAGEMKDAAGKTGLRIHSVMNMDHWKYPLSSPDPAVVERSLEGIRTSIGNAHFWGADTVLVVPAVVNATTTYKEAYERSRVAIGKVLPMASENNVIIGVEEVWNKFLLSPLEFAHYIDEFESPWIRAYFDVGNVVLYGYPQDWIRTLGKRIVKLHIKDFAFRRDSSGHSAAQWVGLGEGDIDWKAVYAALDSIAIAAACDDAVSAHSPIEIRLRNARVGRRRRGLPERRQPPFRQDFKWRHVVAKQRRRRAP